MELNNNWITDWHRAILWWPKAFWYNYEEFLEARFPGDYEAQENFIMYSNEWKDYLRQLDYRLKEWWLDKSIFNISNEINIRVINIINWINIYIK